MKQNNLNIKKILLLSLSFLFLFQYSFAASRYILKIDKCLHEKAFEIAEGEVGTVEKTGNNDGEVEKYLKVVGLGKGFPYCAAGISWSYLQASLFFDSSRTFIPFPLTAGSQVIYDYAVKNGNKADTWKPVHGDFSIWRKRDSYQGHIAIIDSVMTKGWVTTVEFNTSGTSHGNQRDGGGVWRKKRNLIQPLGILLIRGFVGFEKQKSKLCNQVKLISKSTIYKSHSIYDRIPKDEGFINKIYTYLIEK